MSVDVVVWLSSPVAVRCQVWSRQCGVQAGLGLHAQNLLIAASDDGWVRIWNVTVGEAWFIREAAAQAHLNLGCIGRNRRCSLHGAPTTVALSAWLWINPWPRVVMTEACLYIGDSKKKGSPFQGKLYVKDQGIGIREPWSLQLWDPGLRGCFQRPASLAW